MTDLRDQLDDLLDGVPDHVRVDPSAAWRSGVRRRARRRVAVAGAGLLVAVLILLAVQVRPDLGVVQPADSSAKVDGYPLRIEKSWWTPTLPDRPGPVAGLMETDVSTWLAIGPTGHVWRLEQAQGDPGFDPTLSGNGRWLGEMVDGPGSSDDSNQLEIRDLVSGRRTLFPRISSTGAAGLFAQGQAPAFWSPDDRHVVVIGGRTEPGAGDGDLLLGVDGTTRLVGLRGAVGVMAGWASGDTLVWVSSRSFGSNGPLSLVVSDLHGRVLQTHRIAASGGLSQWTASVSPDGSRLVVRRRVSHRPVIETYDVRTGRRTSSRSTTSATSSCSQEWQHDRVLTRVDSPDTDPGRAGSVLVDSAGRTVVTADPRFAVGCSVWSPDALSGHVHRGISGRLFGTSGDGWTWWWREGVAGLVLLAGAGLLVVRRVWRRY